MVDRKQEENFKELLATISAGGLITAMTAGVGWMSERAFRISLSDDPSKSFSNFIKMTANVSICQLALLYAVK